MSHILHAWDAFYAIITTKLCHWWKGTQTWYKFLAIHIDNRWTWTPKCSLPVPYCGIKACVCVKSPQAHTTKDALGARYARHLAFKRAKNWSNFSCTLPPPRGGKWGAGLLMNPKQPRSEWVVSSHTQSSSSAAVSSPLSSPKYQTSNNSGTPITEKIR